MSNAISPLQESLLTLIIRVNAICLMQYLNYNKNFLFNDVKKYHLGITKALIKNKEKASDTKTNITSFKFFEEQIKGKNNFPWKGSIIDFNLKLTFKRINYRIFLAVAYKDSKKYHKLIIIVAYASTFQLSEKDLRKRDKFLLTTR